MDKRAFGIAFLARRYRLLSERPEYLTGTHGERIEMLLTSGLGELDRTLILFTSDMDRLCGHMVTVLRTSRYAPLTLLDAFGVMDPDRMIAVYWALPSDRRERVLRDPVWAYNIEHAPPGVEQAIEETEQLAEETQQAVIKMAALTAGASKADRAMTKRHERTALTLTRLFPRGRG
jgi:hypothetical protein